MIVNPEHIKLASEKIYSVFIEIQCKGSRLSLAEIEGVQNRIIEMIKPERQGYQD